MDEVTDAVSHTKVQWCINNVQLAESVEVGICGYLWQLFLK